MTRKLKRTEKKNKLQSGSQVVENQLQNLFGTELDLCLFANHVHLALTEPFPQMLELHFSLNTLN